MTENNNHSQTISEIHNEKIAFPSSSQRPNALLNKVANVLAASYADSDIRDALRILDSKQVQNTPQIRRSLRLDIQNEVLQCNSGIITEFGLLAQVRPFK